MKNQRLPGLVLSIVVILVVFFISQSGDEQNNGGENRDQENQSSNQRSDSERLEEQNAGGQSESGEVIWISDGDTIRVRVNSDEVTVRIIGIDTPEIQKEDSPGECFGDEATANLERILKVGDRVELTFDRERFDRFDRTLAYVGTDQVEDLGAEQLADGFAEHIVVQPNDARASEYEQLERAAQTENKGLWASCRS